MKVDEDRIGPCFFTTRRGKEDHACEIIILRVRSDDTAVQLWDKSTAMQGHRAKSPCCCCQDVFCSNSFPPSAAWLLYQWGFFWLFFCFVLILFDLLGHN